MCDKWKSTRNIVFVGSRSLQAYSTEDAMAFVDAHNAALKDKPERWHEDGYNSVGAIRIVNQDDQLVAVACDPEVAKRIIVLPDMYRLLGKVFDEVGENGGQIMFSIPFAREIEAAVKKAGVK